MPPKKHYVPFNFKIPKGPGRPKSTEPLKIVKTFRLAPDIVAFLALQWNATETIETAVRRTKEFREWRKENEE